MNTDDGHSRSNIFLAPESLFPEIFDIGSKRINTQAAEKKEYFDIKLGNIDYVDILGLPTEKLNGFKISKSGIDPNITTCGEINAKISEAVRKSAAAEGKKLAGVIGSSGIYIDPFSETSFTELISAYDEQVSGLDKFVDLYVISDVSSMSDMRAALLSCKKTEKPVFVMISPSEIVSDEAGGISALGGLITAQEMGADAFGISCDNYNDGQEYAEAIKELLPYAKIPIIGDLKNKFIDTCDITDLHRVLSSKFVGYYSVERGNFNIPEKISETVTANIRRHDDFFVFTYYAYTFFLEADTTEISEPISCRPDMEEEISEVCKTSCDVLRVEINSNDDAIDFARNAHMSSRPVMFLSENPLALKMALMLYQGIALIDRDTLIPENELEEMCKKYGAVVY